MSYAGLTPAERLRAENVINYNLALEGPILPARRVCLHPDRTVINMRGGYKIECDYCPGFATVMFGGTWPDIVPFYYLDDGT